MTGNRTLIFALCLLALPLFTSWWGLSVPVTLFIIIAMLLWRWGISLSALLKPAQVPDIQLDTISASHFVEKVRWNMDILGIDYEERPVGGTLGVFLLAEQSLNYASVQVPHDRLSVILPISFDIFGDDTTANSKKKHNFLLPHLNA